MIDAHTIMFLNATETLPVPMTALLRERIGSTPLSRLTRNISNSALAERSSR
jgi:hypothetical protein